MGAITTVMNRLVMSWESTHVAATTFTMMTDPTIDVR